MCINPRSSHMRRGIVEISLVLLGVWGPPAFPESSRAMVGFSGRAIIGRGPCSRLVVSVVWGIPSAAFGSLGFAFQAASHRLSSCWLVSSSGSSQSPALPSDEQEPSCNSRDCRISDAVLGFKDRKAIRIQFGTFCFKSNWCHSVGLPP